MVVVVSPTVAAMAAMAAAARTRRSCCGVESDYDLVRATGNPADAPHDSEVAATASVGDGRQALRVDRCRCARRIAEASRCPSDVDHHEHRPEAAVSEAARHARRPANRMLKVGDRVPDEGYRARVVAMESSGYHHRLEIAVAVR